MAPNYDLWQDTSNNRVYRVANHGCAKVRIDNLSSDVQDIDEFFTGDPTPALANTTPLRAWLNSIPTVV